MEQETSARVRRLAVLHFLLGLPMIAVLFIALLVFGTHKDGPNHLADASMATIVVWWFPTSILFLGFGALALPAFAVHSWLLALISVKLSRLLEERRLKRSTPSSTLRGAPHP
jgi:hypothetical protein